MSNKDRLVLATIQDLDVYLSANQIAERNKTHAGAKMSVSSLVNQRWLEGDWPLVMVKLIPDEVDFFMPIHVGHIEIARTVIQRIDEILSIDLNLQHPAISQRERLELLGKVETVFHGSQVIGPEVLLPFS